MRNLVCGASGFIGGKLCEALALRRSDFLAVGRELPEIKEPIDTVYYCAGVTGDFLANVPNTLDANCGFLGRLLERIDFRSVIYLSSTRIVTAQSLKFSDRSVVLDAGNPDHLYNASKALGELTALAMAKNRGAGCYLVRLSNVIGYEPDSPNFFWHVLRKAASGERVVLNTTADSTRDYITLADAVDFLVSLVQKEAPGLYFAASGAPVAVSDILDAITRGGGKVSSLEFSNSAVRVTSPQLPHRDFARVLDREIANALPTMTDLVALYLHNCQHKTAHEN